MPDTPQPILRSTPGAEAPRDVPTSPGAAGMRLGEWDLGTEIGRGAMGIVYHAIRPRDGAVAAVKVLSPRLAQEEHFVERFEREATALSALDHARIVRVLDRGVSEGLPWFAMDLVDGMNLRQRMHMQRLDDAQLAQAMFGVCQALQYAHAQGIVHRDVKPENILIDARGEARIADFGLAHLFGDKWIELSRLSASGGAIGTAFYMAPELLKGGQADGRSDLYSLGAVLYEALVGDLPVGRFRSPRELRSGIDPKIDSLVLRLLEPDPARRPQSAYEVASRLVECLAGKIEDQPAATSNDRELRAADAEATAVKDTIAENRRRSIVRKTWSMPWFLIAAGSIVLEHYIFGLWSFVIACYCWGSGELMAPRYTGYQCPTCHGFEVRELRVQGFWAGVVLECRSCHDVFRLRRQRPVMRSIVELIRGRR